MLEAPLISSKHRVKRQKRISGQEQKGREGERERQWPREKKERRKKNESEKASRTFHDKLAGVGTGHGGTLAGGQDADRPDHQRRIAEAAAQPDAAFVNVNG